MPLFEDSIAELANNFSIGPYNHSEISRISNFLLPSLLLP